MGGASVAAGAVVRDAVVSTGAVIRSDAVVDGSVVGPGAVVGDRAKVTGLTMIGDGMVVEAGAALDGVKFPESG